MVGRWELGLSAEVVTHRARWPSSGFGGGGLPRGVSWGGGAVLCTCSTKSCMLLTVPCT